MRVVFYLFWLLYRSVITILPHLDIVPSKLHADHRMSALSSKIESIYSSARAISLGGVSQNTKLLLLRTQRHVIQVLTVRESMSFRQLSDPGLRNISNTGERGLGGASCFLGSSHSYSWQVRTKQWAAAAVD